MLQIGFGLLLYHILYWVAVFLGIMIVLPFVTNLVMGSHAKGYAHYSKVMWVGLGHFLTLGLRKRES